MENRIQILDCTLRDGGLGLEDASKNKISDKRFSSEDITAISDCLSRSNIDIVEIGSIEISEDDKRGFAIYQNIEKLSEAIPDNRSESQMYVGLYRGPDTPVDAIPQRRETMVDGARVIIRYSELQKSLDFCASLSKKGYKVFVQPMLTMRYTEEELDLIIREANEMGAYALYFVDSYGYMKNSDVVRFLKKYDEALDPSVRIGFHAHNNMNLAFSNALCAVDYPTERKLILDSCALGMGQGAGNLQTEIIASHMNEFNGSGYDMNSVLDMCEIIEPYNGDNLWGYSVTRLIPALHKTAYKYAVALRKHYGLKLSEINNILSAVPEDLRHRYTPENTEQLLRSNGYIK